MVELYRFVYQKIKNTFWYRCQKEMTFWNEEEERWRNCINDEKKMSLFIKVEILEILEEGKVEPF